jgi:uncharacterized protein (TIGR04141 family)
MSDTNSLKQIPLRLYLFEDGVAHKDMLDESYVVSSELNGPIGPRELRTIVLDRIPKKYNARFYLRRTQSASTWQELICTAVSNSEKQEHLRGLIHGASVGGLLLLNVLGKDWAITFGAGRYFLNEARIRQDFGFRIVLNTVRPDSIRHVSFHTFYGDAKLTKQQIAKGQKINYYDIELTENILQKIAGETEEYNRQLLGPILAGGDSLLLMVKCNLLDPEKLLAAVIKAYDSDAYKTEASRQDLFAIVQNLQSIEDPILKEELNQSFLVDFRESNFENMQLAYPNMILWGIEKTGLAEGEPIQELTLQKIRDSLLRDDFGWPSLQRKKIYVMDEDGAVRVKWPFSKSIAYSKAVDDFEYSLMFGRWYRINAVLVSKLKEFLRGLLEQPHRFPVCKLDEDEAAYARRVCDSRIVTKRSKERWTSGPKWLCLDKRTISPEGSTRRYEPCDIFIPKRAAGEKTLLVHIKKTGPDDDAVPSHEHFSHLFVQGLNSAETILQDKGYRKLVRAKLSEWEKDHGLKLEETQAKGLAKADDIKITYLLGMTGDYLDKLPAFSLLTMRSCVVKLRKLGFQVSICLLDIQARSGSP